MKRIKATTQADIKRAIATFRKEANAIVKEIAKQRDKLRALVGEYEDILATVDGAEEEWEHALDHLSQLL
jgi:ABC-type transporter Mla subunit MlaD